MAWQVNKAHIYISLFLFNSTWNILRDYVFLVNLPKEKKMFFRSHFLYRDNTYGKKINCLLLFKTFNNFQQHLKQRHFVEPIVILLVLFPQNVNDGNDNSVPQQFFL